MSLLSLLLRPASLESALSAVAMEIEYLIVGAGGAGGNANTETVIPGQSAGNGGAGGLLTGTTLALRGQSLTVTVGQASGDDSVLGEMIAFGGGAGGDAPNGNGQSGGSGGGGAATSGLGGSGTPGQGTDGQAGSGGLSPRNGGGLSLSLDITGTPVVYATGGGLYDVEDNLGNGGGGATWLTIDEQLYIAGAGTRAANGLYELSGEVFAGREAYRSEKNTLLRWTGSSWQISSGEGLLYQLVDTNAYPSGATFRQDGWAGVDPAPTVYDASGYGLSPSLFGGSGIVVIAYPNDMPALSVGAGLTYDQPSRSGYRVYRFTAGTGTVTFP